MPKTHVEEFNLRVGSFDSFYMSKTNHYVVLCQSLMNAEFGPLPENIKVVITANRTGKYKLKGNDIKKYKWVFPIRSYYLCYDTALCLKGILRKLNAKRFDIRIEGV